MICLSAAMGKGFQLSSGSRKTHKSFTTVLSSALLEWLLITMLFAYGFFGYMIAKFARYCGLPIPCLLCSRIDHILGSEKAGYYLDMMCGKHKLEISSLVHCHFHEKLVDVRAMCESCLFSFATKDKSNAETYRLLVGKLGEEDLSGFDNDPLNDQKSKSLNMKHCNCCNELWTARQHTQTVVQTKSTGFDDFNLDLPLSQEIRQNNIDMKKKVNSFHPLADSGSKSVESLAQYGYTELKVTSDSESEIQMPDAEDTIAVLSKDPMRDLILDCRPMKPTNVFEDEIVTDKPVDLEILSTEPWEKSNVVPTSDIINPPDCPSFTPASATIGHGLEELDWQEFDKVDLSTLIGPMIIDSISESPTSGSSLVDISNVEEAKILPENVDVKDSKDLDIIEAEVVQSSVNVADKPQELEIVTNATDLNNSNARSQHNDGLQVPNHLELGDAYKLAVSSRGRQFSGKLAEQWTGKDSSRVSSELKILLSQLSRGSEFAVNDILSPSPRPSWNIDELKPYDSSTSIGVKLLQKMLSLERNDSKSSLDRNESGFESLDFSTVSEIEGESEIDRLKRQLEHDRKFLISLLKELEEERNASAISANEAMAMITRLQEEKAALQMEASHDLRMMEEQAEYDIEALDRLNDLLTEKEKEVQELEAELEYYRTNYPNESGEENVKESCTNACPSDDEKIRGSPNNSNVLYEDLKSNPQAPILRLENERKHISECLNSLEKKLRAFFCKREYSASTEGNQSEERGKDSYDMKLPEVSVKRETDETADIVALVDEVSDLSKRLRALEGDQSRIERSIDK